MAKSLQQINKETSEEIQKLERAIFKEAIKTAKTTKNLFKTSETINTIEIIFGDFILEEDSRKAGFFLFHRRRLVGCYNEKEIESLRNVLRDRFIKQGIEKRLSGLTAIFEDVVFPESEPIKKRSLADAFLKRS